MGVMAVALAAPAGDAALACIGRLSRRRSRSLGICRFRPILLAAAGASVGAVGRRGLGAARHLSPILLMALVPSVHRNVAVTALLIDIAVPRFGCIGLQVGSSFGDTGTAGTLIGPAGGWDRRLNLLRHSVLRIRHCLMRTGHRLARFLDSDLPHGCVSYCPALTEEGCTDRAGRAKTGGLLARRNGLGARS